MNNYGYQQNYPMPIRTHTGLGVAPLVGAVAAEAGTSIFGGAFGPSKEYLARQKISDQRMAIINQWRAINAGNPPWKQELHNRAGDPWTQIIASGEGTGEEYNEALFQDIIRKFEAIQRLTGPPDVSISPGQLPTDFGIPLQTDQAAPGFMTADIGLPGGVSVGTVAMIGISLALYFLSRK